MEAHAIPSFDYGLITVGPLKSNIKISKNSIVIPAGVYVLGDPYYTAGRDDSAWDQWKTATEATPKDPAVGATYNGFPVVGLRTSAEGLFTDSLGRVYNTNSGVIGLVPLSLAKQMGLSKEDTEDDGYIVTFNEPTTIEEDDGTLYFGDNLFIETGPGEFNYDLEDEMIFGENSLQYPQDRDRYFNYNYDEENEI